jgi:hypothetical protein
LELLGSAQTFHKHWLRARNAVQSGRRLLTFRRNIRQPSIGLYRWDRLLSWQTWRRVVSQTSTKLHGVTFRKTAMLKINTIRTYNLTNISWKWCRMWTTLSGAKSELLGTGKLKLIANRYTIWIIQKIQISSHLQMVGNRLTHLAMCWVSREPDQ